MHLQLLHEKFIRDKTASDGFMCNRFNLQTHTLLSLLCASDAGELVRFSMKSFVSEEETN